MRTQLSCTKKYKHSKTSFLVTIFDWECIFTAIFLHHNFWLFSKQYLLPHFLFFLQYFTSYTILNNNLDKKCYNNRINVAKKYRDLVGKYDLKLNEKDDLIEKAPFLLQNGSTLIPQTWEYGNFFGNLYSLCSPGNQLSEIYLFFNFFIKKVEVADQRSIIKNI